MKSFILISLLLFSTYTFSSVVVVAHKSSTANLDKDKISRIYLNLDKKLDDGSPIIPIGQVAGSPVTEYFNKNVIGKSSSQYKAYWSKLLFTGKGTPPREVEDDASVIRLISTNPDLIGYIQKSSLTDDVKVIGEF